MRYLLLVGGFVLLSAVAVSASAASGDHIRYRWTDGEGNLHFDDSLPDRALKFGYDVISPHGRVLRHVDRQMTPAELKVREQAAAQKRREQRAALEQEQNDRQMLAAYPHESDLKREHQSRLNLLDQNIRATRISLSNQEQSLTQQLTRAANLERNGKHIPSGLTRQIETRRRNIEHQKQYIASKEQEKIESDKQFALRLAHYRKLKAEQVN